MAISPKATTGFLLSGMLDMCLRQTVLLHGKLRNEGVDAALNVFEGM